MRIALAQLGATGDSTANLRRVVDLTAQAARAGAALVLFPECVIAYVPAGRSLAPVAEPLDGPFGRGLADAARRHGVAVVAGVYEPADGGRVFNTVVAVDRTGERLGAYRKIHLYDAFGYRESDQVAPGDGDTLLFALDGLSFGVQTCYDLRFPELSRHLALRGADVILLPAAWVQGPLKEAHWELLLRARAVENTVYVAAAGQVSRAFAGGSMLVDPMGVPVARAGEVDALVVGDVDPDRLGAVRRTNPSLEHVRPDVYTRWATERRGGAAAVAYPDRR